MKRIFSDPTGVLLVLFGVLAVSGIVLLCLAGGGAISRERILPAEGVWNGSERTEELSVNKAFAHVPDYDIEGFITIPLPEGASPDSCEVVQDISHRKTTVFIRDVPKDFYSEHPFSGASGDVTGMYYRYIDGTAELEILTDGILEAETMENNGKLYLGFVSPRECFPRIYVVDPGHGGDDPGHTSNGVMEKDVALQLSLMLAGELSDESHGVYLTRSEDVSMGEEERSKLIRDLEADAVIGIHAEADPVTRVSSGVTADALYGADPVIAGSIARAVSEATGLDIFPGNDTEGCGGALIAGVPCYRVGFGFLTNKRDATFVSDGENELSAARAIADAIRASEEQ
ncbi:MAG: N-acetylmuramoyl-L-alanine amidase [Lachnospiraceae bacterium]|nr:N-acetylmuramoyl-L-alanine amidase [Lachnospiraceae bacterium]